MSNNNSLQELKNLISLVLDDCDKYDYPHVCNMARNPDTRPILEKRILEISLTNGASVQNAIVQMERTYNPNMIED